MPFDEGSSRIYGKLRAELEKKGTPLMEADLRIASIALYNDFVVITGNVKHFLKVPRLLVENWL